MTTDLDDLVIQVEEIIAVMVREANTEVTYNMESVKKLEILNKMLTVAVERRKGKQGSSWVVGKSTAGLESEFD